MALGGTAFVGAMAVSPDVVNRLATVTKEFKGVPAIDTSVPVGRGAHMTLGGTAFVGAMAASPDVVNRLATVTNEFKGMPAIDTSVPVGGGAPMALGGTAFVGAMAASPGRTDSFTREGGGYLLMHARPMTLVH